MQGAALKAHVQRIDRQQAAAQASFYAHQQLERFRRLQRANNADQRREDSGGRATQLSRLAFFGKQAVVAGHPSLAEVEDRYLPVELDGRARYQRHAPSQAGTIDGITGHKIVAAIQHRIGLFD